MFDDDGDDGRQYSMSRETVEQTMALLEEAGVIYKTGERRNGQDVYAAVPGKEFEDYLAWLGQHGKC